MKPWTSSLTALCVLCGSANAQTLTGITLEPASIKVGEPVKITGSFDDAASPNCNVRLHYGDGKTQDFKINQLKDVPLVASRSYDKPGQYTLMIEPKSAMPMLKCVGSNQRATLTVVAAAPVPAPATPAASGATKAAAAPACPKGWKLDAKSVNKKTGAFICSAKAGTTLPATRPDCPGSLGYFENKSKGQLGCRA